MKYSIKPIAMGMIVPALMTACTKKPHDPGTDQQEVKPNIIKGDIYDARGNKLNIPNSILMVNLWSVGGTGNPSLMYTIRADGNSHYEKEVVNGIYTYDTRATMPLNGHSMCVPLEPLDGKPASMQFNSAGGLLRNFKLSLTGLMPGGDPANANSYYGGHVSVCDGAANYSPTGNWDNLAINHPGSSVAFTLTPKSNCIDGSTATIQEIVVTVENLQGAGRTLVNIPLARYYLSALLRSPTGQQTPLRLTFVAGANGNHFNFLDFTFTPAPNDPNNSPSTIYAAVWED